MPWHRGPGFRVVSPSTGYEARCRIRSTAARGSGVCGDRLCVTEDHLPFGWTAVPARPCRRWRAIRWRLEPFPSSSGLRMLGGSVAAVALCVLCCVLCAVCCAMYFACLAPCLAVGRNPLLPGLDLSDDPVYIRRRSPSHTPAPTNSRHSPPRWQAIRHARSTFPSVPTLGTLATLNANVYLRHDRFSLVSMSRHRGVTTCPVGTHAGDADRATGAWNDRCRAFGGPVRPPEP